MNKKVIQTVAFVAFIGVAITALYYGGVFGNSNGQSEASNAQRVAQKVEILKYSDYQCPACKAYVPIENQLKAEYGDMVELEYRYFPLQGHQFSDLAARSAEAANQQGKFQEMHNLIFQYQEQWSQGGAEEYFFDFAEQIGLDMEQFEEDLESDEVAETVNRQRQEGIRRTVNSTPTYFLNGQKLRQNPRSYDQFKAIVELYMYRSEG
ncbi:DsbA family protein [Rhodohalobacter sp. 614A]|uniref:DsbA family protein n=1 Tax=Rhodohalobacter sp. 614A TaxID=2908649 RepID=UPI001F198A98|nr:thioredoxin domain-containing protein [Rhodohalobacter sp. 614A]